MTQSQSVGRVIKKFKKSEMFQLIAPIKCKFMFSMNLLPFKREKCIVSTNSDIVLTIFTKRWHLQIKSGQGRRQGIASNVNWLLKIAKRWGWSTSHHPVSATQFLGHRFMAIRYKQRQLTPRSESQACSCDDVYIHRILTNCIDWHFMDILADIDWCFFF